MEEERPCMRVAKLRPQPAMPLIREIGATDAEHLDMSILATLNALQPLAKTWAQAQVHGRQQRHLKGGHLGGKDPG
jgi:hypothetical protein